MGFYDSEVFEPLVGKGKPHDYGEQEAITEKYAWLGVKNPEGINIVSLGITDENEVYLDYQEMADPRKLTQRVFVGDHVPFGLVDDGTINDYEISHTLFGGIKFRNTLKGFSKHEFKGLTDGDYDWRVMQKDWGQMICAGSLKVSVQKSALELDYQTCYRNDKGNLVVKGSSKTGYVRLVTVGDQYRMICARGAKIVADGINNRETTKYLLISFDSYKSYVYLDSDNPDGRQIVMADGVFTQMHGCFGMSTPEQCDEVISYILGKPQPEPELLLKKKAVIITPEDDGSNDDDPDDDTYTPDDTCDLDDDDLPDDYWVVRDHVNFVLVGEPYVNIPASVNSCTAIVPVYYANNNHTSKDCKGNDHNDNNTLATPVIIPASQGTDHKASVAKAKADREALRARRRKAALAPKYQPPTEDEWIYTEGEDQNPHEEEEAIKKAARLAVQIWRLKMELSRVGKICRMKRKEVRPQRYHLRKYARHMNPVATRVPVVTNTNTGTSTTVGYGYGCCDNYAMARMEEDEETARDYISSLAHFKTGAFDLQRFADTGDSGENQSESEGNSASANKKEEENSMEEINLVVETGDWMKTTIPKLQGLICKTAKHNASKSDLRHALNGYYEKLGLGKESKCTAIKEEEAKNSKGQTYLITYTLNGSTWNNKEVHRYFAIYVIFSIPDDCVKVVSVVETVDHAIARDKKRKQDIIDAMKAQDFVEAQKAAKIVIENEGDRKPTITTVEQFNARASELSRTDSKPVTVRLMSVGENGLCTNLFVSKNANAITKAAAPFAYSKFLKASGVTVNDFVDQILTIQCDTALAFMYLVDPSTMAPRKIYAINDRLYWHDGNLRLLIDVETRKPFTDDVLDTVEDYVVFGARWSVASAGNQKNRTIEYYGIYFNNRDKIKQIRHRIAWDSIFDYLRFGQEETIRNRVLGGFKFSSAEISTEGVRLANAEAPYRQFSEAVRDIVILLEKDDADGTNYLNADFVSKTLAEWAIVDPELCEGLQVQGRGGRLQEKVTYHAMYRETMKEIVRRRSMMKSWAWNDPHIAIVELKTATKAELDLLERLTSVQVKPHANKTMSAEELAMMIFNNRKHTLLPKSFESSEDELEALVTYYEANKEIFADCLKEAEKRLEAFSYEDILGQIKGMWGDDIKAIRVVDEITDEMTSGEKAPDMIADPNGFKTGTRIERNIGKTAGLRFLGVVNQHDVQQRTSTQFMRSIDATIPLDTSLQWNEEEFLKVVDDYILREINKKAEKLSMANLRQKEEEEHDEDTGEVTKVTKGTPDYGDLAHKLFPHIVKYLPPELAEQYNGTLKSLFAAANRTNYPIKGIHGQLTPDPCYMITGKNILHFVKKTIGNKEVSIMETYVPRIDPEDHEYGNVSLEDVRNRVKEQVDAGNITEEAGELVVRAYEHLHPGLIVISTEDAVLRTIEGADFDGDSGYLLILEVMGHKLQIFIRYPKTHLHGYAIVDCDEFWVENNCLETICVNIKFNKQALKGQAQEREIRVGNTSGVLAETVASNILDIWGQMSYQLQQAVLQGKNPPTFLNCSPEEFGFWGSFLYQLQEPRSVGSVINEFSPLVDLLIWYRQLARDKTFRNYYTKKGVISLADAWIDLQMVTSGVPNLQDKRLWEVRKEVAGKVIGERFGSELSMIALENIIATARTVLNIQPFYIGPKIDVFAKDDSLAQKSLETVTAEETTYVKKPSVSSEVTGKRYGVVDDDGHLRPFMATFDDERNVTEVKVTYELARKAMSHAARFKMSIDEYAVDHGIMERTDDGDYAIVREPEDKEDAYYWLEMNEDDNGDFWTPGVDNRLFLGDIGRIAWDFNAIIRFYGEGTIDQVKKPVAEMIRELLNELNLKRAKPLSKHCTFGGQGTFEDGIYEFRLGAVRDNGGVVEEFGATYEDAVNATTTIEKTAAYLQDSPFIHTQRCMANVIKPYADYAASQVNNGLELPKEEIDEIVKLVVGTDGEVSEFISGKVGNTFNVLTMMWRSVNTFMRVKREQLAKSGVVRGSALYDSVMDTLKAQKRIIFDSILNTANVAFDKLAEDDPDGFFKSPATRARLVYIATALGSDIFYQMPEGKTVEEFVREKAARTTGKIMKQFAGSSYMSWIIELAKKIDGETFEEPKTFDRVYLTGLKGYEKDVDGADVLVENGTIRLGKFVIGYLHDSEINGVYTLHTEQEEDRDGNTVDRVYLEESIASQLEKIAETEKGDPSKVAIQLHEYFDINNERIYVDPERVMKKVVDRPVFLAFGGIDKNLRGFVADRFSSKRGYFSPLMTMTNYRNINHEKGFGLYVIENGKPVWLGAIQGTSTSSKDFAPALRVAYGAENIVMKAKVTMAIVGAREEAENGEMDEDGVSMGDPKKVVRESVVLGLEDLQPATDEEIKLFDPNFNREAEKVEKPAERFVRPVRGQKPIDNSNPDVAWANALLGAIQDGTVTYTQNGNAIGGTNNLFEGKAFTIRYSSGGVGKRPSVIVNQQQEDKTWKAVKRFTRDEAVKWWTAISAKK